MVSFARALVTFVLFPDPLPQGLRHVRGFPHSDYYALFDCLQGFGAFGPGLPSLLPTLLAIPDRLSRVHSGELKQDAVGGVFLNVPSTLCGSLVVLWGRSGSSISPFESAIPLLGLTPVPADHRFRLTS